jgi:hypothetical protein
MFDRNPAREFYLEESFPLNWMYPYLSPHSLILKINRSRFLNYRPELVKLDREYWAGYIERMTGAMVDVQGHLSGGGRVCRQVYLNGDFRGFDGDQRLRAERNRPTELSKLRSSIGGLYAGALSTAKALRKSACSRRLILRFGKRSFSVRQARRLYLDTSTSCWWRSASTRPFYWLKPQSVSREVKARARKFFPYPGGRLA